MKATLRTWGFRAAAMVLGPILLLGALEGGLRLASYGHHTRFFNRTRIGGRDYVVYNDDFSLRFFPPQLARWPDYFMFPAQKPPGTYRIFVLGESAARGEPQGAYSAARYLEAMLEDRYPGRKFEVINVAMTAINSHVLLPIAQACAAQQPDLWLIYMGNNEMVGPFGAATVFGQRAPPVRLVRLQLLLGRSRLGQMVLAGVRRMKGKSANAAWGGMNMFTGNTLMAEDPRRERVYRNFERNLEDILRTGAKAHTHMLLSTVAVNLKDCPPFASARRQPADAAWQTNYQHACELETRGDFAAAITNFEAGAKAEPDLAELQFRWGECLAQLQKPGVAREHFEAACDHDALPFRADRRINAIIRSAAQRYHDSGVILCDANANLAAAVPGGIPGRESFYEHVHLTFAGNYRLARAWADQLDSVLPFGAGTNRTWATQEACERRLGVTDWNRCAVLQTILERLHRPPLAGQFNNMQRMMQLESEFEGMRRGMNPATAAQARGLFTNAIAAATNDPWLRANFADVLESMGDVPGALTQWQQLREWQPGNCFPWYQAGRLLAQQNRLPEAEPALLRATALRPNFTEAWFELGNVQLTSGRPEPALRCYQRAEELDPKAGVYCAWEGKALARLNRRPEAIARYQRALELQPDLWEVHLALADELLTANQLEPAAREYEEVARTHPTNTMAHLAAGVTRARLGHFDASLRHFQEILRLDPANQQAQEYYNRVQSWKAQRGK